MTTEQLRAVVAEYFAAMDAVNAEVAECSREGRLTTNAQQPSWPRYAAAHEALMPALRSWNAVPDVPVVGYRRETTFGTEQTGQPFRLGVSPSTVGVAPIEPPHFLAECPECAGRTGAELDTRTAAVVMRDTNATADHGPIVNRWVFTGVTCVRCMTTYTLEAIDMPAGGRVSEQVASGGDLPSG